MITYFNTKKEINLKEFIGRGGRFLILHLRELKKRNIECQDLVQKRKDRDDVLFLKIRKEGKTRWLSPQKGYFNTKQSCELALHKDLTYKILESVNLPVPQNYKIEKISQLKKIDLSYPVVVKPTDQAKGKGVLIGIKDREELKKSVKRLLKKYSSLIVEEYIPGNDYRLLILDKKLLGAIKRTPPKIKADGKRTIRELIRKENKKRYDRPIAFKPYSKTLEIDLEVKRCLREQGYSLNSIPKKDEKIIVRRNTNFSSGGETLDVTKKVHPENIKIAKKAIKSLGLKFGGVDFVAEKISEPISRNNGRIVEINGIPGIWIHHFPNHGQRRNIAKKIIDYLFEN